jgi:predicted nucleotidyltransferase
MENNLSDSIIRVCQILNKHSVQYIIVGGTAVALHGYYRRSINLAGVITDKPDLDFWYNPTYENYFKLLNALADLGQDVTRFKNEKAPNPRKSFFRFELEKFTLDFLPQLKAPLKFITSFKNKEVVNVKGTDILFISYEDLIVDKETNMRTKDITDIEQLKMIKQKNK